MTLLFEKRPARAAEKRRPAKSFRKPIDRRRMEPKTRKPPARKWRRKTLKTWNQRPGMACAPARWEEGAAPSVAATADARPLGAGRRGVAPQLSSELVPSLPKSLPGAKRRDAPEPITVAAKWGAAAREWRCKSLKKLNPRPGIARLRGRTPTSRTVEGLASSPRRHVARPVDFCLHLCLLVRHHAKSVCEPATYRPGALKRRDAQLRIEFPSHPSIPRPALFRPTPAQPSRVRHDNYARLQIPRLSADRLA